MRPRLDSVTLKGFKTIRELDEFRPGSMTVLIGPNGAGKSNFLSFFRLLAWALPSPGSLQQHVGTLGGASALLHDGPERTRDIEAHLRLLTDAGKNDYFFRLAYAANDTLIFTEEKFRLHWSLCCSSLSRTCRMFSSSMSRNSDCTPMPSRSSPVWFEPPQSTFK